MARQKIEATIDGAPAMYVQGFCGDVHPRHMFGSRELADMLGERLGAAAAEALATLFEARAEPFDYAWQNVDIESQPMPSREQCERELAERRNYIEHVTHEDETDPWCCGFNAPDPWRFSLIPESSGVVSSADFYTKVAEISIDYFEQVIAMHDRGEQARRVLQLPIGAVRMGDVGAALSAGENFTITGKHVRDHSPFVHTLICGDTGGLFGDIGNDREIERGGFETKIFWTCPAFEGVRIAPATGSGQRVIQGLTGLLEKLHQRGA